MQLHYVEGSLVRTITGSNIIIHVYLTKEQALQNVQDVD